MAQKLDDSNYEAKPMCHVVDIVLNIEDFLRKIHKTQYLQIQFSSQCKIENIGIFTRQASIFSLGLLGYVIPLTQVYLLGPSTKLTIDFLQDVVRSLALRNISAESEFQ